MGHNLKRFTDTDKWRDPWFRNLTSQAKQLWLYLLDNCDKVGLVQIDLRLASADCGQRINETHLAELGSRIEDCGNGKHLIPKFIHFQYGTLSESCNPHRPIIELVRIHSLVVDGLNYHFTKVNETRVPDTLLGRVQDNTRQDKNGKEQEGGDARGGAKKPSVDELKLQCVKIGLPEDEAQHFWDFYESNGWKVSKNPMKSWQAALQNWKRNYDERRFQANGTKTNWTAPRGGVAAIKPDHSKGF